MENAVQALLIAAGVIIGMLILSLGVSLYSSLNGYVDTVQKDIISQEVQKFNEKFVKYINCDSPTADTNFTLTIQDVVTAANTAYESNLEYGLTEYKDNNFYVTVILDGRELQQNINNEMAALLTDELGKEYKCSLQDVLINEVTGRVYEVKFSTIEEL